MAQTKRKRRTKHRGNAAGKVEARGRTGRRPTAEEQRRAAKGSRRRELPPPSWKRAVLKAAGLALLLFLLTQTGVLGQKQTPANGVTLALFSFLLYTPAAYATDRWAYNRQERRRRQRPAGP